MSGISRQQLIRKHLGIVITHAPVGEKFVVDVTQHGKLIYRQPDDIFATGCQFVLDTIWRDYQQHWRTIFEPEATPVYSFINGFNVDRILNTFDFITFDEHVLPRLEQEINLKKHVEAYNIYKADLSVKGRYLLFDVLVRIFLYLRYHNILIEHLDMSKMRPTPVLEGLTKMQEVKCFLLDQDELTNNTLLATLRIYHKNGKTVNFDGKQLFVTSMKFDIFSVAGGSELEGEPRVELEVTAPTELEADAVEQLVPVPIDNELVEMLAPSLYNVINKPFQNLSAEEKDFLNYGENVGVIGKDGIGVNALKGAGKICGVGTVEECAGRVFAWLRRKSPGRFSDEDVMRSAFGRIAKMQSAKIVERRSGTYIIRDLN